MLSNYIKLRSVVRPYMRQSIVPIQPSLFSRGLNERGGRRGKWRMGSKGEESGGRGGKGRKVVEGEERRGKW